MADPVRDLLCGRFRANPDYQIVAYEHLSRTQRELLSELRTDPAFFGVLVPRNADRLSVKSICQDTARLIDRLTFPGQSSGPLPEDFDPRENQTLARLVLDGVLEIETDSGFLSGADARSEIFRDPETPMGKGYVFNLSLEALRYGQTLSVHDRQALSARLYFYHRLPVTPAWVTAMPTSEAALRFLGLQEGTAVRNLVDSAWREVPVRPGFEGWRVFKTRASGPQRAPGSRFKLYISPEPRSLPEALAKALPVLQDLGAPRFKIGRDVYNLLRPDKLVVYFPDFDALSKVADQLSAVLKGIRPHGVPFTSEYAGDGLISWGTDPPVTLTVLSWQERESWRLWLANRLASALLDARGAAGRAIEPWRYALDRLRLENVDTTTWAPTKAQTAAYGS